MKNIMKRPIQSPKEDSYWGIMKNMMKRPIQSPPPPPPKKKKKKKKKRFLFKGYEEHNEEAHSVSKGRFLLRGYEEHNEEAGSVSQKRFLLRGFEEHNEEADSVSKRRFRFMPNDKFIGGKEEKEFCFGSEEILEVIAKEMYKLYKELHEEHSGR